MKNVDDYRHPMNTEFFLLIDSHQRTRIFVAATLNELTKGGQSSMISRRIAAFTAAFVAMIGIFAAAAGPAPAAVRNASAAGDRAPTVLERVDPSAESQRAFKAFPGYNPDPCYHDSNKDAADLCAQWRAALAAERSAEEAKRATNLAIINTILSAGAFLGLLGTVMQGRKMIKEAQEANKETRQENIRSAARAEGAAAETAEALNQARRNADAADRQAALSEQSLKRRLRAYLHLSFIRVSDLRSHTFNAQFMSINHGLTPATQVNHYNGLRIMIHGVEQALVPATLMPSSDAPVAPSGKFITTVSNPAIGPKSAGGDQAHLINMLERGFAEVQIFGRIEYCDAFGDVHTSRYNVAIGGEAGLRFNSFPDEDGEVILVHYKQDGNSAD